MFGRGAAVCGFDKEGKHGPLEVVHSAFSHHPTAVWFHLGTRTITIQFKSNRILIYTLRSPLLELSGPRHFGVWFALVQFCLNHLIRATTYIILPSDSAGCVSFTLKLVC